MLAPLYEHHQGRKSSLKVEEHLALYRRSPFSCLSRIFGAARWRCYLLPNPPQCVLEDRLPDPLEDKPGDAGRDDQDDEDGDDRVGDGPKHRVLWAGLYGTLLLALELGGRFVEEGEHVPDKLADLRRLVHRHVVERIEVTARVADQPDLLRPAG